MCGDSQNRTAIKTVLLQIYGFILPSGKIDKLPEWSNNKIANLYIIPTYEINDAMNSAKGWYTSKNLSLIASLRYNLFFVQTSKRS